MKKAEALAKAESANIEAAKGQKEAEIEALKLQLKARTEDIASKDAEIAATRLQASTNVAQAESADLATKALLTTANSEIDVLRARVATMDEENAVLRNKTSDQALELSQITSGTLVMPPAMSAGTPVVSQGSTSMPMAMAHMVDTPIGTPIKTTKDRIEALALGTACGDPDKKAEGCVDVPNTNVKCDVPEQVMRAICDYSSIPVPADLRDVALTYSVLDPGSKVRMQLQEALRHFTIGKDLILRSSNVVLDRSLVPLRKLYDYAEISGVRMAGMVRGSNAQYARFLDANAGSACRQVFQTLYGTSMASLSQDSLASIGLEMVQAPEIFYKVTPGPFGQVFRRNAGEYVGPVQIFVHPAFNQGVGSKYPLSGDNYAVHGVAFNLAGMEEGKRHMAIAITHLANAAATYIYETAYDEKTVMIPGTSKIPAGAFAMLPRADVNAVLAASILYPRALTSSRAPALSERITLYDKDEIGSLGSRICAVGNEVLDNYSRETNLGIGELTFEAKSNPANSGVVMAEAAKRVAEITRLAEAFQ
jgi:hypothetical protein